MAWRRFLVAADSHGDRADPDSIKEFLAFNKDWKPHTRIHLGDFIDLRPLRHGASTIDKCERIEDDIRAGLEFLDAYRPHFLTLGNHDTRLWEHAETNTDGMTMERAVLYDLCEKMVQKIEGKLKGMGCRFTEYDVRENIIDFHGIRLLHGFLSNQYPARHHAARWGNCLAGHNHVSDFHQLEHYDNVKAFSVPALCQIAQNYNKRFPRRLKHSNGFLFGVVEEKSQKWEAWTVRKEGETWLNPIKLMTR